MKALTPIDAVRAWLDGDFGIGDEAAFVAAIRRDTRVSGSDDDIIDAVCADNGGGEAELGAYVADALGAELGDVATIQGDTAVTPFGGGTGAILAGSDLRKLAELLRETSAYLLSDEVYEHIVFDGEPHVSALSIDELWARSFVVSSFGKTYHATGWKVGYCMAPAALGAEFRKVHQFTTFAVNTPVQHALADFLAVDVGQHHVQHNEVRLEFLREHPRVEPVVRRADVKSPVPLLLGELDSVDMLWLRLLR